MGGELTQANLTSDIFLALKKLETIIKKRDKSWI